MQVKLMMYVFALCFASSLLVSNAVGQTQPNSTWQIQDVNLTSISGWYANLKLDSAGNPHIVHYINDVDGRTGSIAYSYWRGSSWITEIITSHSSSESVYSLGLALDSYGKPNICYIINNFSQTSTNSVLAFASRNGSSWNIESVDSFSFWSASDCSIDIDSSGKPCIAYGGARNCLKYANWNGSSWNTQIVYPSNVYRSYCSLTLDSNDNPHISFVAKLNGSPLYSLIYTSLVGTEWVSETVDTGLNSTQKTSLDLDSQKTPYISYYAIRPEDSSSSYLYNGELRYAYRSSSGWTKATLVESGWATGSHSLAIDNFGKPHIAFEFAYATAGGLPFAGKNVLRYLSLNGYQWTNETVASGGSYCSLAFDSNNKPHFSFCDSVDSHLKYATLVYLPQSSPTSTATIELNSPEPQEGTTDFPQSTPTSTASSSAPVSLPSNTSSSGSTPALFVVIAIALILVTAIVAALLLRMKRSKPK